MINGEKHWLWRAVDQDGHELDILVQSRCNKKAAKRFLRRVLKGLRYAPRVLVTDKLRSYGAANKEIMPGVEHRQHKGLNNRAENSHQAHSTPRAGHETLQVPETGATVPLRARPINNLFRIRPHLLKAHDYRNALQETFEAWRDITLLDQCARNMRMGFRSGLFRLQRLKINLSY